MSMEAIRKSRGVPAKRGMRVLCRHSGRYGTIMSASSSGSYLRIKLDGDKHSRPFHPTWKLDYLDESGDVVFRSTDE